LASSGAEYLLSLKRARELSYFVFRLLDDDFRNGQELKLFFERLGFLEVFSD
jgi:hypothetical protein